MRQPSVFMGSRMLAMALALVASALSAACSSSQEDHAATGAASGRFATPLDLAKARAQCLQEKGWKSEVNLDDGTIGTPIPAGMTEKFQSDDAACFKELGVDPNRRLTSREFDFLYEQYTHGMECLESIGHSVPERPSRQVFEESYMSNPWFPWSVVPRENLGEALQKCPLPDPIF